MKKNVFISQKPGAQGASWFHQIGGEQGGELSGTCGPGHWPHQTPPSARQPAPGEWIQRQSGGTAQQPARCPGAVGKTGEMNRVSTGSRLDSDYSILITNGPCHSNFKNTGKMMARINCFYQQESSFASQNWHAEILFHFTELWQLLLKIVQRKLALQASFEW